MRELVAVTFLVFGAALMVIATIGVLRMPDLFMRLQATAKAATLGIMSVLLGGAVFFDEVGITIRSLAVIGFLLLTAPIAAHMIGRAAYFAGVRMWHGTVVDELHGRYDPKTHELASGEQDRRN